MTATAAPAPVRPDTGGSAPNLFPPLFDVAEQVRWPLAPIDWSALDLRCVDDATIQTVVNAFHAENTTWEATQRFMQAFGDDADFSQWIAVWFYEETKHPASLQRWLEAVGHAVTPDEMLAARVTEPFVESRAGTLAINVISEQMASASYLAISRTVREPTLRQITQQLAADEARHAASFLVFLQREVERTERPGRERRKVLTVLNTWFFARSQMTHPGLTASRSIIDDRQPQEGQSLSVADKICRAIGLVLGIDDLRTPADIAPALARERLRIADRPARST